MITQFEQFTEYPSTGNPKEIEHIVQEYLGGFERRMLCFESPWNLDVYSKRTCKPFIENLNLLTGENIEVGYRFFESAEQLRFYLQWPDGLAWKNPCMWGNSVTYIASHGAPAGLQTPQGLVSHGELQDIFKNFGNDTSSILYLSSCDLFKENLNGWALLEASKCRGILGFQNQVGYTTGMIIDLLFLSAFFLYTEGDPMQNLKELYTGVIEEFPLAKEAGFTLFC
jgi:hypothetical protein